MGVAAAFLFMKDDRARLAVQAEPFLDPVDRGLKNLDGDALLFRRAQA